TNARVMTQNALIRIPTFLLLAAALCVPSHAADLKSKTTVAFDRYVAATETRFARELRPDGNFLFVDGQSDEQKRKSYEQLKQGEILVEKLETKAPGVSPDVPDGIVHHWVGLVFIPGATLAQTLRVVKDYDRRAELYKPDVIASRLVAHHGDDYKMFLRLHQKKFTTVVFNTDYDVHWGAVTPSRVFSNSISTRIAEVKDPDKPDGDELPVGTGHGYLWRLNTYWRFEEKDGGVYLQCEALSLTRDIPTGLGWLLKPLVTAIPKQSLNRALGQTLKVVLEEGKKCCAAAQSR
ncbi:MAG TPA: hypothetical protein VE133_12950, partial [Candidatus Sulfotelmatobacter sp.]|nr:hypothetical protein [Candidatus Sulfotelmatobacter sp.]